MISQSSSSPPLSRYRYSTFCIWMASFANWLLLLLTTLSWDVPCFPNPSKLTPSYKLVESSFPKLILFLKPTLSCRPILYFRMLFILGYLRILLRSYNGFISLKVLFWLNGPFTLLPLFLKFEKPLFIRRLPLAPLVYLPPASRKFEGVLAWTRPAKLF